MTDDFVAAHGWIADKTARALTEPLAPHRRNGRKSPRFWTRGLQSHGLAVDVFRVKNAERIQIVRQVLDGWPPAGPIEPEAPRLNATATRSERCHAS